MGFTTEYLIVVQLIAGHLTLTAYIKGRLNNQAADAAVSEVLARLSQGGLVTLPDGKVTYPSA